MAKPTGTNVRHYLMDMFAVQSHAALIYQHATCDRDQAIAKALGAFVRDVRNVAEKQPDTGEREEREA